MVIRKKLLQSMRFMEVIYLLFYFLSFFFIFGLSGLFLWWGRHAFLNLFTDLLTPPEKLESANNIINQWNVLMYFVPFILFSLSIGCLATALLGVLIAELAFWFEYAFEKSFQRYLNRNLRRKNKMKEGEPDVHP
ncbi:conjugal transfer protein TrbF [Klebsiella pneumoniae]